MTRPRMPGYLIGLDLGKNDDYTALGVLKQRAGPAPVPAYHYDLVHLDRWRGRRYLDAVPVVREVVHGVIRAARQEYVEAAPLRSGDVPAPVVALLVDQTGVGIAVIESLRAAGLACIGITIHGGDAVSRAPQEFRVPKRELVGTLQVLIQNRRLHIAERLAMADTLIAELDNFRATTKLTTGHDVYGAGADWRDGNHDDLVLAVAMAAWFGESQDPVRHGERARELVQTMRRELS